MIEMKYEQLSNQGFLNAVSSLARQRMPIKAAYNVKKMADAIHSARKAIGERYMTDIVEKYAKRDEKGEKIYVEGELEFDIEEPAKKDAFLKAQEEFGQQTFKIERNKLILGVDLTDSIELSAGELAALDPVLVESISQAVPILAAVPGETL